MMTKTIPPNEDNLTPWATWPDKLTHRVMIKSGPILLPALTSEQAKELGQALIDNAWEVDAAKPLESLEKDERMSEREQVEKAIAMLPAEHRQLLIDLWYDGWDGREAGSDKVEKMKADFEAAFGL